MIKWIGQLLGEQGLHAGVEMVRHTYAVVVTCAHIANCLCAMLHIGFWIHIHYLELLIKYDNSYLMVGFNTKT